MKISVPKPCYENWNEMLPEEKGRFCLSCQKCVYDLSKISDKEIIITLKNEPNICIKSNTDELRRINHLIEDKNRFKYLSFLRHSTLFLFLGIGTMSFSQEQKLVNTISQENNIAYSKIVSNDSIRILKGRVVDSNGNPIE